MLRSLLCMLALAGPLLAQSPASRPSDPFAFWNDPAMPKPVLRYLQQGEKARAAREAQVAANVASTEKALPRIRLAPVDRTYQGGPIDARGGYRFGSADAKKLFLANTLASLDRDRLELGRLRAARGTYGEVELEMELDSVGHFRSSEIQIEQVIDESSAMVSDGGKPILLRNINTRGWVDGKVVGFKQPVHLLETAKVSGSTVFVAEPLDLTKWAIP